MRQELVALDGPALERWIILDPDGCLGLLAADVTSYGPKTSAGSRWHGLGP